jgi:hypothetical protein
MTCAHSSQIPVSWSQVTSSGNDDHGGGGEQSDQWYLGSSPTFGANAAYSLYGVLKDKSGRKRRKKDGCNKANYINSFVTYSGVQAFTYAMGTVGVEGFTTADANANNDDTPNYSQFSQITSSCYSSGNGNNNNNNNNNDNGQQTAYYYQYSAGSTSSGLACMGSNFVVANFEGATCDGHLVTDLVDTLDTFNAAMQESGECVELFDAANGYAYYFGNNNNNNDHNNNNNNYSPLALLQSSISCSTHDVSCPDPYGKLQTYTTALELATGSVDFSKQNHQRARQKSAIFFSVGMALMTLATILAVGHHASTTSAITTKSSSRGGRHGRQKLLRGWFRRRTMDSSMDDACVCIPEEIDAQTSQGDDGDDGNDSFVSKSGNTRASLVKAVSNGNMLMRSISSFSACSISTKPSIRIVGLSEDQLGSPSDEVPSVLPRQSSGSVLGGSAPESFTPEGSASVSEGSLLRKTWFGRTRTNSTVKTKRKSMTHRSDESATSGLISL